MTEPNRQSGENEERSIEIEIERLRPFKEHPFQVKDDNNTNLMQFTMPSGLHSVLERPFSEANGRPFLVKRSPLIVC